LKNNKKLQEDTGSFETDSDSEEVEAVKIDQVK